MMADAQPDALGLDCAVSAALPGVSSTHDSLSTYEAATGFRPASPQRTPRATFRKLNADGTVDLDALHAAWSGHVGRLLSRDGADLLPVQASSSSSASASIDRTVTPEPVVLTAWAHGAHVSRPSSAGGLPSAASTPSTDTVDLTSDSGHSLDDDTESLLSSPAPDSPLRFLRKSGPGTRLPALAPRIRRLSVNSSPTTSFPSPSASPDPHGLSARFGSSLSLDLDYPPSPEDSEADASVEVRAEDLTPTATASVPLPGERTKRTRTRDLVDQMRRAAVSRLDGGSASSSSKAEAVGRMPYPTPPPSSPPESEAEHGRPHTPSTETPSFVRPPLGSALPRCSADLKESEEPWWTPMEATPPSSRNWTLSPPRRGFSPAPHGAYAASMAVPTADDFPALPAPSPPHTQQAPAARRSRWHKKAKSSGGSDDGEPGKRGTSVAAKKRTPLSPAPLVRPAPVPPHPHAGMMYPPAGYGGGAFGLPGPGVYAPPAPPFFPVQSFGAFGGFPVQPRAPYGYAPGPPGRPAFAPPLMPGFAPYAQPAPAFFSR